VFSSVGRGEGCAIGAVDEAFEKCRRLGPRAVLSRTGALLQDQVNGVLEPVVDDRFVLAWILGLAQVPVIELAHLTYRRKDKQT
jgi:hypothetical protein